MDTSSSNTRHAHPRVEAGELQWIDESGPPREFIADKRARKLIRSHVMREHRNRNEIRIVSKRPSLIIKPYRPRLPSPDQGSLAVTEIAQTIHGRMMRLHRSPIEASTSDPFDSLPVVKGPQTHRIITHCSSSDPLLS
jgi:hypothetical protein